jgi:hypothetical protein
LLAVICFKNMFSHFPLIRTAKLVFSCVVSKCQVVKNDKKFIICCAAELLFLLFDAAGIKKGCHYF